MSRCQAGKRRFRTSTGPSTSMPSCGPRLLSGTRKEVSTSRPSPVIGNIHVPELWDVCSPWADTAGMVTRLQGLAAMAGLVAVPALLLCVIGCTGSPGQPSPAGSPGAAAPSAAASAPAASVCTRAEVKAAISGFFDAWNHQDAAALGRLFTADGALDMATKHQDTLHRGEWAGIGGLGARGAIAAFAGRQWRLGEKLSYRGMSIILNGGADADGGYAGNVRASFADGTVQPMEEAKFVYSCAGHALAHVVIVSAKAAAPA